MTKTGLILILILVGSIPVAAQKNYLTRESRIEKKLHFPRSSDRKEIVVDNINGSIRVEGHSGDSVQLVVEKTITARSERKVREANESIYLDISTEDNSIVLYVQAPYRRGDGSIQHRGWRYYGYDVSFDFRLRIPYDTDVDLKTINDGEILVRNVKGDFTVDNVNGGIEFFEATGAGRIYALNGDVTVRFENNPRSDCYFGSLNGQVKVMFADDFSADLRLKTFNGEVFTDFPVSYLSQRRSKARRKAGKFIYKSDKSFGVRVGNGGPELEFDAFNGNIYITKI